MDTVAGNVKGWSSPELTRLWLEDCIQLTTLHLDALQLDKLTVRGSTQLTEISLFAKATIDIVPNTVTSTRRFGRRQDSATLSADFFDANTGAEHLARALENNRSLTSLELLSPHA